MLRGCVETKAPARDDVTMWRYRVDVVPKFPKCPVPGFDGVSKLSGTGIVV